MLAAKTDSVGKSRLFGHNYSSLIYYPGNKQ